MKGNVYKRGDFVWVQDVRANFVCIKDGDLVATVFSTAWEPWQIIMHRSNGQSGVVTGWFFDDPWAAIEVVEDVITNDRGHPGRLLQNGSFAHAITT